MDIMENTTKIITAWELHQQGIPKTHIAEYLSKHRETIHLWIKNIEKTGLNQFLTNYELSPKLS